MQLAGGPATGKHHKEPEKHLQLPKTSTAQFPLEKRIARTNCFREQLQTNRYLCELQGHQVTRGVKGLIRN